MNAADPALDFAALFNQCESVLWWLMAALSALWLWKSGKLWQRQNWGLPVAFGVFAISDLIEARTGAWWTPWWLLLMKGCCVIVFAVAFRRWRRVQRQRR